ncbi:MAG: hypothetical protein N7Q72_07680, partial [Spiroplasma sp. Tabriz.8]|nr:hypothetical protein [Spiroplasma sp. Tabriz.8]
KKIINKIAINILQSRVCKLSLSLCWFIIIIIIIIIIKKKDNFADYISRNVEFALFLFKYLFNYLWRSI